MQSLELSLQFLGLLFLLGSTLESFNTFSALFVMALYPVVWSMKCLLNAGIELRIDRFGRCCGSVSIFVSGVVDQGQSS